MMTATQLSQQCPELTHDYVVTDRVYDAFRTCSGDINALHVDDGFAHDRGFSGRVMYGNILNAFLSHFAGMLLPTDMNGIPYLAWGSEAVGVVIYKFKFTRDDDGKRRLIARGHIQIGILA